ncbi:COMM domain-containing protein 5 isoform X1 [Pleurodeles waltl]|uniref:COMM domain-containing protein 5 isoform X1 n=1 Tax=Pleurodeles waltl TaxID=8319 RepID=UPI003709AFCC
MAVPGKQSSTAPHLLGDRSSFLGARIPHEVEAMARSLRDLHHDTFRKILKAVVGALEGKDSKESVKNISENETLSEEQLSFIIAGLYTLIKKALRLPMSTLKQDVFKEDLKELRDDTAQPPRGPSGGHGRIPEEFIADLTSIIFGNRRQVLEDASLNQETRLPSIEDLRWRVDVAISTSSLARALQPSILMQLKLSNGTAHRFEVPVTKFQELRYNVALLLKEMNDLEKRSILKIKD